MRHDIAVVIATICRSSLTRAVRSIFGQTHPGRIQILVGVDRDPGGCGEALRTLLMAEKPDNITLTWLDLGYSTSRRNGGVHACFFGGSLRSALTLLADSENVVYLDDDDWLAPTHCADILPALAGKAWAFAYCFYADGDTGRALAVDELESVGVGRGVFAQNFGGFVRPSGMAINKLALINAVHLWACSPFPTGDGEDRLIFQAIREAPHACTGRPTVYYAIDPKDGMHPTRLEFLRRKGVEYRSAVKQESIR